METKVYTEETLLPSFDIDKPTIVDVEDARYYVEMISNTTTVYVFGGGHVGQEVVPVLSHLGFYTVVIDPREGLANPTYFPTADQIHCFPYTELEERLDINQKDYVILMTNTHKNDLDVLQRVLKKSPFYLGVMGSRAKVKFITDKLLEQGYAQSEIDQCHMPIGLNISAETPAEIAISIAGELIHYRSIRTRNQ